MIWSVEEPTITIYDRQWRVAAEANLPILKTIAEYIIDYTYAVHTLDRAWTWCLTFYCIGFLDIFHMIKQYCNVMELLW